MRPLSLTPLVQDLVAAVRELAAGRGENGGSVTLTANAASTVVKRRGVSPGDVVHFTPMTANAAGELGAGTMYVPQADIIAGQFTITHANNAQADRTFRYTFWAAQ